MFLPPPLPLGDHAVRSRRRHVRYGSNNDGKSRSMIVFDFLHGAYKVTVHEDEPRSARGVLVGA